MSGGKRWLSAEDVALILGVNRKTVREWARQGAGLGAGLGEKQGDAGSQAAKLRGFETQGRHLRFAPREVQAYLSELGEDMAPELAARRPKVAIVFKSSAVLKLCEKAVAQRFSVAYYTHMADALLDLRTTEPEAFIFDPSEGMELARACLEAMAGDAQARFTVTIAFTRDPELSSFGALCNAVIPHALPGALKNKLCQLLGVA